MMTPSSNTPVRNHQCSPSMGFQNGGFLNPFYSCWKAKIWHTSEESHIMTIYDVKDDPLLKYSIKVLHIWTLRKCQLSSIIINVWGTSHPQSPYLRGWLWGHPEHHWLSWYVILYMCAKFQLSSMNKSGSRTPRPWSLYFGRMLMVPDCILAGWGHLWHYISSW